MTTNLLWVLSTLLILAGLAGIVLPVLPGTVLVLAGIVLGAWIGDFKEVGALALTAVAVLAVLAWLMDYVSAALGAKRAGASRQAIMGAAIGTVAGLKVVRWHHNNPGNRIDRVFLGGTVARANDGQPVLRLMIVPRMQ